MSETRTALSRQGELIVTVSAAVLSASLLLLGLFGLRAWGMSSTYAMAVQHLVIFSSGAVMGGTLLHTRDRHKR